MNAAEQREEMAAWADQIREVSAFLEALADALDDGDDVIGALAGQGLTNTLPALPQHIRAVFTEYLSDEAAAGYQTDLRYQQEQAA